MEAGRVKKTNRNVKQYVRKDGTVVTKEYEQTYLVADKTEKNLRKKINTDIKTASIEQLQYIDAYLNGGGKDRDAGGAAAVAEK